MKRKDIITGAVTRCDKCGRYIKRGIINVADHYVGECPEGSIILWDGKSSKLIKRKNIN